MLITLFSALLYVIPFWYPALWPLVFLFPALLTTAQAQKISFVSVLLWAFMVSMGHLLPVAHALYTMAQGPPFFKAIPGTILIIYITLCATLWLALARYLKYEVAWIASLWLFMIFLDRAVMLPLSGSLEGSIFMNPLLLLPACMLTLLPYVGMILFLGFFCITSSTIGLWFCRKINMSLVIVTFIPWIISIGMATRHETDFPYNHIGYLPIMTPKNADASSLIKLEISYIQELYPHITTIIIPESSCHQIPTINSPVHVIMGSFENHQTTRSNIACWLHDGKIEIFRKKHTMVFGETLPYWLDNRLFQSLIFATALPILKGNNDRPQWCLHNNITLVPYICSELFFAHIPQDPFCDPVVAICNDWWFDMPHFKKLMAHAARLRAIQWHRPIIYVSYFYGLFFDQFGTTYQIERL